MITVDLNNIELTEFNGKVDQRQHCRATFPLIGAHGSKKLATVYFELEPGDHLGTHTDSAEELLIILDGDLTAIVGDKQASITKGNIALVPKMVPHDLKNTGNTTAKVLGVFGGAKNIIATFENELMPINSNIVDTAKMH